MVDLAVFGSVALAVGLVGCAVGTSGGITFVEHLFLWFWSKWPMIIGLDELGGWRRTWADVSSGHVVMRPASMASHHVLIAGENMAAW